MKIKILRLLLIALLLFVGFGGQAAPVQAEPVHPRLYFNQDDIANLRALKTAPSHQAIWNDIKSWADAEINEPPPSDPSGDYWSTAFKVEWHIETMAFMYAMTDDTSYADSAKTWMLAVASWSDWGNRTGWMCESMIATGMAFGYDVLFDYLTSSEKSDIRDTWIRILTDAYNDKGRWDFEPDYPNSVAVVACGIGLSALALQDEYENAADWLDFAVYHTSRVLNEIGIDGGWFEGARYGTYSLDYLVSFLHALKEATGQNLFDNDSLRQLPYYFIYQEYNKSTLQLEDCDWYSWGWDYHRVNAIYRLASEYNDGYAQWFADRRYSEQSSTRSMRPFIWKDPDVVATPPAGLPLTRHFRDLGYVIFRTGWEDDDLLIAFKSGTSRGHAHPSQNEFSVYYQGMPITCGPGYVCLTPADDTWPHNCLLVNGNGQGQEPGDYKSLPRGTRGVIEQVEVHDPYYRYVSGDASAVYNGWSGTVNGRTYEVGELDKWLRHIVFIENPGYFVIYDEVAASEAKQFDWLLQAPNVGGETGSVDTGNISVTGNTITLTRSGAKLVTEVLEPENFAYQIIPYNNPAGPSSYIKLHPSQSASSVHFLTAHFPLTSDGSALPAEKVAVGNLVGVKTIDGENLDLILFSLDGNPVDEYIELGGTFEATDGGNYSFESTGVRVQFDSYQVLRLRESSEDWDVNDDGAVNVLDMIAVGQHWDEEGLAGWIQADVNEDGIVNMLDMVLIGQHWTG